MTSFLVLRSPANHRDGLTDSLTALGDGIDVVTVDSEDELLADYRRRRPSVVLMGLEVENAIATISRLLGMDRSASIVAIGAGDGPAAAAQAFAWGARGFLRRADLTDLSDRARSGRTVAFGQDPRGGPALTTREMQVLVGMSEGRSNSEIGREYYLSEDTIKTHARRLFRKLGAADRAEAVANGFRRGLLR